MKIGNSASSFLNANTDSFNRANDPTSLGISDRGIRWGAVRDTWQVLDNEAYSAANQASYALAAGSVGINNINSRIVIPDGTSGAGLAFWVEDANNWYGVFPYYNQTGTAGCFGSVVYNNSGACGGCPTTSYSYQVCDVYSTNTSSGCCSGITNVASSTYCAGPSITGPTSTGVITPAGCCPGTATTSTSSTCTTGGTGNVCNTETTYVESCSGSQLFCSHSGGGCTPSGCGGCYVYDSGQTTYYTSTCSYPGQFVSGNAPGCGTFGDQCDFPGQVFSLTCYARYCFQPVYEPVYTYYYTTLYYTVSCSQTQYTSPGYSYCYKPRTESGYYCNPYTTTITTTYAYKVIKMVSGVVTEIATVTVPSAILGLRAQTNGTSINITAYSDVNLSNIIGQSSYSELSATRGVGVGVLYAPTLYNGSSVLDNFGVE